MRVTCDCPKDWVACFSTDCPRAPVSLTSGYRFTIEARLAAAEERARKAEEERDEAQTKLADAVEHDVYHFSARAKRAEDEVKRQRRCTENVFANLEIAQSRIVELEADVLRLEHAVAAEAQNGTALEMDISALEREVAELREALRPFGNDPAGFGEVLWRDLPDDAKGTITICLGDIRRAAALAGKTGGGDEV